MSARKATRHVVVSLITTYVCPPLPARDYDWEAYYLDDELDEDRCRGYGRDQDEAVNDLRKRFPRKD